MKTTSLTLSALAFVSCAPASDLDPSRIDEPRFLAVRMEPPEATPGTTNVTFTALIASPDGTVASGSIDWAWCLDPRLPTDTTNIPARCSTSSAHLTPFASGGFSTHAVVPSDACSLVGPSLPPTGPDAHPQRVPDPDSTGAYSIPARASWNRTDAFDTAFARVRIECPRGDVPSDVAIAYAALAQPNHNPTIARVDRVDRDGRIVPVTSDEVVSSGADLALALTVSADSAEQYARISNDGRSVEQGVETLDVSWFAAGGRFDANRTIVADGTARNVLHVDTGTARAVTIWMIVRDGRGGTEWREFRWAVQ